MYFETILNCNNIINISDLPDYKGLPPTKFILELIYKINPEIFKNDKIFLNCFDDIAFIYGYTFTKLPQRWTTIKQKFDIEKSYKKKLISQLPKI